MMNFKNFLNESGLTSKHDDDLSFFIEHFLKYHKIASDIEKNIKKIYDYEDITISNFIYDRGGDLIIDGSFISGHTVFRYTYRTDFIKAANVKINKLMDFDDHHAVYKMNDTIGHKIKKLIK